MLQQFSGRPIQATHLFQKLSPGQGMNRPVTRWNLRRVSCRDQQANRLNPKLSPELTGNLKADQSTHAVAEEGKRFIQERPHGLGKGPDKRRKLGERSLCQPRSPTRELNRADLDIGWQAVLPGAKNRGAGSCVRKTEQTEAGLRVRFAEGNP